MAYGRFKLKAGGSLMHPANFENTVSLRSLSPFLRI